MTHPEPDRNASKVLAGELRVQIKDGTYQPGSKLPSYRQLRDAHRVALNTAQVAIRMLAAEGLVEIRPATGAFVRTAPDSGTPTLRAELASLRRTLRRNSQELAAAERQLASILAHLPAAEQRP